MSPASTADAVAELRQRRRDTRRELARVRWWRRLVQARRDLAVAFLARPDGTGDAGLDLSWEALAAGAPTGDELARVIWPDGASTSPATLDDLDRLDAGLEAYETRVAATLDNVTAQMVRALADAHRMDDGERGP